VIEAFVHGKLSRAQENMEDLLTSSVFGLLKHAPVSLTRFIARASMPDGSKPLRRLEDAVVRQIQFWPWLAAEGLRPCEPDVRLDLETSDGPRVLLVEAKFLSGKSSFARDETVDQLPTLHAADDQLAREWQNLQVLDGSGWVVYLTADYCIPVRELDESQQDLRSNVGRICWLSWRDMQHVTPPPREEELMRDVRALLERLDLRPFLGVSIPSVGEPHWGFAARHWSWLAGVVADAPTWRFARPAGAPWFSVSDPVTVPSWRFSR
jgi:hypothetical protein